MLPVLLLLVALLSIAICYSTARARGASVRFWVIMALLLGPLAVPFVFFAKRKRRNP